MEEEAGAGAGAGAGRGGVGWGRVGWGGGAPPRATGYFLKRNGSIKSVEDARLLLCSWRFRVGFVAVVASYSGV